MNLDFRNKMTSLLKELSINLEKIRQQRDRFKSNNDGNMDRQIKEMIAFFFNKSSFIVVRANNFFELMFKNIKETQRQKNDPDLKDSRIRMTYFITILLRSKFNNLVGEMNKLQLSVSFEYQKKVERTLRIYKADLSEKEVRQLSRDPRKMNEFIQQQMMMSPQFEDAVREIDERLSEIRELEKNMNKLFELIKELHGVVRQQNVIVDSITETMGNIQDHSEKTCEDLVEGKDYMIDAKQVI